MRIGGESKDAKDISPQELLAFRSSRRLQKDLAATRAKVARHCLVMIVQALSHFKGLTRTKI
jgi:hypothetical protein